jgi:ribosomal protein S27E
MVAPTFMGAMGQAGRRRVHCPYCDHAQLVPRKPAPYQVPCKKCGRKFVVSDAGAAPLPQMRGR